MYLVKIINNGIETYINTISTSPDSPRISGQIKFGINTIDTIIAIIPTNNEINFAILVCFSKVFSLATVFCISNIQLVAIEFNPVDNVDCAAAYIAAKTMPDIPTGN